MSKTAFRNQIYWQDRMERIVLANEQKAINIAEKAQPLFDSLSKDIEKTVNAFYGKYAKDMKIEADTWGDAWEVAKQKLTTPELKSFRKELEAYAKQAEELKAAGKKIDPDTLQEMNRLYNRVNITRQEQVQAEFYKLVDTHYTKLTDDFTTVLGRSYEDTYYKGIFHQQQALGFSNKFASMNPQKVMQSLNERWMGTNYSDIVWSNHKGHLIDQLNTTFQKGIIQGWNPNRIGREMAKAVESKFDSSQTGNFVRVARTEFIHIANQASYESYKELGVADEFRWLATLEKNTCSDCAELDGTKVDMENAVPGFSLPPLHPNCRCTIVPYIEPTELDRKYQKLERAARHPITGETYMVPDDLTFNEWKKGLEEDDKGKMQYTAEVKKEELVTITIEGTEERSIRISN